MTKNRKPRANVVTIFFAAPTTDVSGVREKRTTVCCGGGNESFTDNIAGCGAARPGTSAAAAAAGHVDDGCVCVCTSGLR